MNSIKITVRSVYHEKCGCPSPHMNARWSTPGEAANVLHVQAMWDWLSDDQEMHWLNMPLTQVMINSVIEGVSVAWVPHITLLLQN